MGGPQRRTARNHTSRQGVCSKVKYDKKTRKKAQEENIKTLAIGVVFFIGLTLVTAFFSLEMYTTFPIPSPLRTLFKTSAFDEFSNNEFSGLGTAISRSALQAHLPAGNWLFELSPEKQNERSNLFVDIVKRNKGLQLIPKATAPLAHIREALSPHSQIFTEQIGMLLFPGETVRFSAGAFSTQNPKLIARCLGATPDRKEAPANIEIAVAENAPQSLPFSPRGEIQTLEVNRPNADTSFAIHWPASAPGALFILGEDTPHQNNLPGIFLVSIDNMQEGLAGLSKTQKVLRDSGLSHETLFPFWPTSSNPLTSISGIFTGQPPSVLGLTAPASAFETSNPFGAPETLESRLSKKGYRTIRIKVGPENRCQECATSPLLNSLLSHSNFDLSITALRNHEVRQTLESLFNDFDGNLDGLFIHVSLELPANQFAYTWNSALSPQGSPLTWMKSAWFGDDHQNSTSKQEKEIQIDKSLSAVFSKIKNPANHRLIVVATTTNSPLPSQDNVPASPGEAWLPTSLFVKSNPLAVSQTVLFNAIPDFTAPNITDGVVAPIQTSAEEVFVTQSGWISLPISLPKETDTPAPLRSHIPFTAMEATQNAIQKYRESYAVQAVHLLVPNISAQSGFQGEITIPFRIFTCQSSHTMPSIQIKVGGENQNTLSIVAKPETNISTWRLTCLVAYAPQNSDKHFFNKGVSLLRFSAGETPLLPNSVAIGEHALSGALFSRGNDTNLISIPNSHIFLPAFIAPQFRPPYTKSAYFWLERFPAMQAAQGRRS
jgi:hypothetical protein